MADRTRGLTSSDPPQRATGRRQPALSAAVGFLRMHPLLQVVAVYALARIFTTVALLVIRESLTTSSRGGVDPGFFDYSAIWDGQWYWFVSAYGYPSELPLDTAGHIDENQWAFMPVYPAIVRVLSLVTGSWPVAGFFVALIFGFAAAVMIYRLFRLKLDHSAALFGVVLFSVSPLSFILQMAYAESLQLFLLALALHLLIRRRFALLFPVVAVLALVRPTGLALALALGLYWLVRLRRRAEDPFPPRQRVLVAGLAVFTAVMGFAWLLVAWAVTGSPTAYTDTELAWRSAWIGQQHLVPFGGWFQAAPFWVGDVAGPFVVIGIVVLFAAILLLPPVRRLGVEMWLWMASYGIYLFAVFFPQSSLLRLLMPMFPLAGALASARGPVMRTALVLGSLVLQVAWLWATWGPTQRWWSIP